MSSVGVIWIGKLNAVSFVAAAVLMLALLAAVLALEFSELALLPIDSSEGPT